jgi:hypothetical protein
MKIVKEIYEPTGRRNKTMKLIEAPGRDKQALMNWLNE